MFCFLNYQVLITFVHNCNENVLPLQTLPHHIPPPHPPLLPPVSSSSLLFPLLPAALPQSFLVLPLSSPESDTETEWGNQMLWRPLLLNRSSASEQLYRVVFRHL